MSLSIPCWYGEGSLQDSGGSCTNGSWVVQHLQMYRWCVLTFEWPCWISSLFFYDSIVDLAS